jgi:hypothetical protein
VIDLSDIPVVDNHVHPWREATRHLSLQQLSGQPAFSDTAINSVRKPFLPPADLHPSLELFRQTNLGSRYLLGELARFLDVEEDWQAVLSARNVAAESNYQAWTNRLFTDVGVDTLLVDEGGGVPRIALQELATYVPGRLWRVARTDNFIRDLLAEHDDWARFLERYQQELEAAIADGAVAFKSVIAYRTGLDVQPVSETEARRNFELSRHDPEHTPKPLLDFLLCHTLDVARERDIWMRIHTGFGDAPISVCLSPTLWKRRRNVAAARLG